MNASAGPASGPGPRALPARWRPGTDSERIDVRRGDVPYERVVGYDPSPGFGPVGTTQAARSPDGPGEGSA